MHRRSSRTLAAFAAFSLLASATLARGSEADTQLQAIYRTEWQWREQELPDELTANAAPQLMFSQGIRLQVEDEDADQARSVIAAAAASNEDSGDDQPRR